MTIRVTNEVHEEYEEYVLQMFGKATGKDKICLEYVYNVMSEFIFLKNMIGDDYAFLKHLPEIELWDLKAKLKQAREREEGR